MLDTKHTTFNYGWIYDNYAELKNELWLLT